MKVHILEQRGSTLYCPDFPDAAKLVAVSDAASSTKYAHLCLHAADLHFALQCLDELDHMPTAGPASVARRALWNAALVATYKCFGQSNARSRLKRDDIYSPGQVDLYNHYLTMRDKHIVHDDNDMSQGVVGAVLEQPGVEPKVREVFCTLVTVATGDTENSKGLRRVAQKALDWVTVELDALHEVVIKSMNYHTYSELDAMPRIGMDAPAVAAIGVNRKTPGRVRRQQ